MRNMLKKALTTTALAGAVTFMGTTSAHAEFLDFTVNEKAVPGSATGGFVFVADKMNGLYSERITFASDPALGATTFEAMAIADFTAWARSEGTVPIAFTEIGASDPLGVGDGPLSSRYSLYALVSFTGTYTGTTLIGNTASVSLYVDPDRNTVKTLGADGNDAITRTGEGEDLLVLSTSTLVNGFGSAFAAGGFFDITLSNITKTAFGNMFFPDLTVLNLLSNVDGDLDVLTPSPATGAPFTFLVTGDVSNVFVDSTVPEPATLTLFGLGLAGTAVLARRRRQAQA